MSTEIRAQPIIVSTILAGSEAIKLSPRILVRVEISDKSQDAYTAEIYRGNTDDRGLFLMHKEAVQSFVSEHGLEQNEDGDAVTWYGHIDRVHSSWEYQAVWVCMPPPHHICPCPNEFTDTAEEVSSAFSSKSQHQQHISALEEKVDALADSAKKADTRAHKITYDLHTELHERMDGLQEILSDQILRINLLENRADSVEERASDLELSNVETNDAIDDFQAKLLDYMGRIIVLERDSEQYKQDFLNLKPKVSQFYYQIEHLAGDIQVLKHILGNNE